MGALPGNYYNRGRRRIRFHSEIIGLTRLQAGCMHSEEEVRWCLRNGCDVDARYNYNPYRYVSLEIIYPTIPIDMRCLDGFSALHFTMLNSEPEHIVELLLRHRADINCVDTRNRTPLHIACLLYEEISPSIYDHVKTIRILLENRSDLEARDRDGNTPLLTIFNLAGLDESRGRLEYLPVFDLKQKLEYLVQQGADVTAINHNHNTILHNIISNARLTREYGCEHFLLYHDHHKEMVMLVLETNRDININARNIYGESPLQLAVLGVRYSIVKVLLDRGADLRRIEFIFDYPEYLQPSLDTIQHLLSIVRLFVSKGFKLTWKHRLAILKFILHDIETYCACECYANTTKFETMLTSLLNYGSSLHVQQILFEYIHMMQDNRMSLVSRNTFYRIIEEFYRSRNAGIYVDNEIFDVVRAIRTVRRRQNFQIFGRIPLERYQQEHHRMVSVTFRDNVTLADIMSMHPHHIYKYIFHYNFQRVAQNFVIYKDIIEGHVAKSLVRHFVVEQGREAFSTVLKHNIDGASLEWIMKSLSNDDILKICFAADLVEKSSSPSPSSS